MRIIGIDYTDPSLIDPCDPAHPNYRPTPRCGACHGTGTIPCSDCDGESDSNGMVTVDGELMHCEQKTCVSGRCECYRCDGHGHDI